MYRIDSKQFNKENKILFQKENWFIFLDFGDYTQKDAYYPRLAHKCNPQNRETYLHDQDISYKYTCCIVIINNEVCRDCHESVPEVFSGFFNLAKWGYEEGL